MFRGWTRRLGGPNPVPATWVVGGVFHTNAQARGACALPRHAAELAVSGFGALSLSPSVGVQGRRQLSPTPAGTAETHRFPSADPTEIAATGPQGRFGDREHQSPGPVKVAGCQGIGVRRALPGPSVHHALLPVRGASPLRSSRHWSPRRLASLQAWAAHPLSRYLFHPDFCDALRMSEFGRSVPPLLSSRFSFLSEKRA